MKLIDVKTDATIRQTAKQFFLKAETKLFINVGESSGKI